ncbi:DVU_1551 family NTP transferase [Desulfolucanica intricata]|uniref:DVU_1551 family NTP transferase n=1 Tax=Desulfolucanica intricata TaxID=1285191 RepID=UPI00082B2D67|nr:NTP transferase domain-containing protein [Desulfolucanica intricata]
MSDISALILAAGYSSRMGTFKPLLPMGNTTVIAAAVNNFRAAGINDVRVVVGYRAHDLIPVLDELGVLAVYNENYDRGMFSSVQSGVKSLPRQVDAFFILPVDNPLVRPKTISEVIRAREESNAGIVYPSFAGQRGHPPLIASDYAGEIISSRIQANLREVLTRHEAAARDIDVIDQGVLLDMDTPEDYRRLLSRWTTIDVPNEQECEAILNRQNVSPNVISHCRAVAALARRMALLLNEAGCNLRPDLAASAGLLHDLAKGQPDHAAAGAEILYRLGFPGVAEIIACHMGQGLKTGREISERELVYLADKLVHGQQVVSLAERFSGAQKRYAGEPEVLKAVLYRRQQAELIKQQVEKILGLQLETILG